MLRVLATNRSYAEVSILREALDRAKSSTCCAYGTWGCENCKAFYVCRDLNQAVNYCDKLLSRKTGDNR